MHLSPSMLESSDGVNCWGMLWTGRTLESQEGLIHVDYSYPGCFLEEEEDLELLLEH